MRRLLGGGAAVLLFLAGLAGGSTAVATAAELSTSSIDFGVENTLNDVVAGYPVTVSSNGDPAVEVEEVVIDQAEGGPFAAHIEGWCFPSPPSTSCARLTVWFNYGSAPSGPWNGTLKISTNLQPEPFEVELSGTIVRTTLEISEENHDFGEVPLGLTEGGPAHSFTITSTGSVPFKPGWSLTSDDQSFKVQSTDCNRTLEPAESCDVTVVFRPSGSEPGLRTGRLDVNQGLVLYGAVLVGKAYAEPKAARLLIKATRRSTAPPGKSNFAASATNRGGKVSQPFVVRVEGPARLVNTDGSATAYPALSPGRSIRRRIPFRFRRAAAGRKVKLKLIARQRGKVIWSATRTVRVLAADRRK